MLYLPEKMEMYQINLNDLIRYIKSISPGVVPDIFYCSWIDALAKAYEKNGTEKLDTGKKYLARSVHISNRCTFKIHYDADRLRSFSDYYNVKSMTADEFKKSGIIFSQSAKNNYAPKGRYEKKFENPIMIVTGCPDKSELKPRVILGHERLSERIERNFRLDCIFVPEVQASYSLSQIFEQAWYLFLYEHNQYIKLENMYRRYAFIEQSAFHKFI